ncbi:murein biosynthesis integral membrane protein MurJ [Pseudactinotalea terrae]|uniref:murein biosynthesis integral membrane protein MurJ n=1 Tax=Pseudactinotalea terrae TaxID=1743262 RepID=UPI0012E3126F|nr:lipid II flippase MurJ [Pseudactinotalea terrae]
MSSTPPSGRSILAGVAGAAGSIAVLTVLSRLLGFGRWMAQSATVGPTATGDAYATANLLPNVLYEVVAGGALAGVVVPLLAAPIAKRLRDQVDDVASALLTWALIVLVPVGVAVALLARPIASILPQPGGADPQAIEDVTTYFLIVFSPQVPLYGIGVVLTGVLQAHRKFLAPAIVPIASTVVVIVSYFLFGRLAERMQDDPAGLSEPALAILAWGTTAGVAALSLPLLLPVLRAGVRLRPRVSFPPGVARRLRSLAAAGIGGVIAQQLAAMVIWYLARSGGLAGTFNVFQYTQAVYLLPYAVLAVPLVTVFQPRLAELSDGGVGVALTRLAERSTRTVLAAGLFGAGLLVAVAPAAHAAFGALATGSSADPVAGMTQALTWMAPGVVGLALLLHAGRMLLALDRSRATVIATASAWLVTAVAAFVVVRAWAPEGGDSVATLSALGVGHAVGMSVGGVVVLLVLRQIMHAGFLRGVLRTIAVGGATAAVGAVVGRLGVDAVLALGRHTLLSAIMAALLGAVVVTLATFIGIRTFDRAILASVRSAHG